MNKFLTFGLGLILTSCSYNGEFVKMNSVGGSWDKKAEQKFSFEVKDSQVPKNIIFVVRNNNDYPYSNIRFIVNYRDLQTKKTETDTLNYVMAEPNGKWIGTGFGNTKEILFQYRLNHKFPANGKYEIGILQAMRKDKLPGIEDLGIKIEPAKP